MPSEIRGIRSELRSAAEATADSPGIGDEARTRSGKRYRTLLHGSRSGLWLMVLVCLSADLMGVYVVLGADAASARSAPAAHTRETPQGRTWDSIKHLPDWSGVWVLTDASWTAVVDAIAGADPKSRAGRAPFTPAYLAISAQVVGRPIPGKAPPSDNEWKCIPVGIPESTAIPIGHEYLFSPGRVTAIFENGIVRRIDTSGRRHPPTNELDPTFAGNSIGHWEGHTLVVDTIGILPHAEFLPALHVTANTHLEERIFRRDRDTLQIDSVLTDPAIFTTPWSYTRLYKRSTLPPFEYYPCVEGNRDVMVNGQLTGVDVTPPR